MFITRDDASVWDRFLTGDDQAYEYIYRQHVQKLFLYGMTVTKDEDLVRDCIQDVFIRIQRKRKSLGKTNNIRLYLIAALRNAILNSLRMQHTRNTCIDSLEKEEPVDEDTPMDMMINREEESEKETLVNYLLSVLTPRQREIVYYRFMEGMGLDEIAKMQNMDYHSVANVIQRALKKMRKFIVKIKN